MNYKMMGRFIGKILMVEGVFMIPALLISLWEREYTAAWAFWWSMAVIFVVSMLLKGICRGSKNRFVPGGKPRTKRGEACAENEENGGNFISFIYFIDGGERHFSAFR